MLGRPMKWVQYDTTVNFKKETLRGKIYDVKNNFLGLFVVEKGEGGYSLNVFILSRV